MRVILRCSRGGSPRCVGGGSTPSGVGWKASGGGVPERVVGRRGGSDGLLWPRGGGGINQTLHWGHLGRLGSCLERVERRRKKSRGKKHKTIGGKKKGITTVRTVATAKTARSVSLNTGPSYHCRGQKRGSRLREVEAPLGRQTPGLGSPPSQPLPKNGRCQSTTKRVARLNALKPEAPRQKTGTQRATH